MNLRAPADLLPRMNLRRGVDDLLVQQRLGVIIPVLEMAGIGAENDLVFKGLSAAVKVGGKIMENERVASAVGKIVAVGQNKQVQV